MAECSCKKSEFDVTEEMFKEAAFDLHQATERFYTAFLLVHTGYKPKFHDIEKLGKLAASEKNEMMRVFPLGTDEERRRFELLRRAYIDARYSKTYEITRDELEYLQGRVRVLCETVERLCRARIAELERE
jgi:HEPN domain-containing protein